MLQQVTCLLQHTVPQRADDDYHIVYEDGDEEDVDVVEFSTRIRRRAQTSFE